jgi:DNA-binding transcriptional MocR family regulator
MSVRAEGTVAGLGVRRQAATERAFREAWQRLEAGMPTHPDLRDHEWQLSISVVCLEARHSRNALYQGHPELVHEIRAAIAKKGRVTAESRHVTKRNSLEAALAACRAERQRLISENATLLLRALTAEESLARMQRRTPQALKITDDRPEAS